MTVAAQPPFPSRESNRAGSLPAATTPGVSPGIQPRFVLMSYVELHARSAFSFLEGSSAPEDLIGRCAQLEIPAMAMLDRNSLSGAVRFHKAAEKTGLRAIIGAEIAAPEGFRYALLAESQKGYQNLCRLITKIKLRIGHGEHEDAVAHPEDLAEHAEGLVCL